MITVSVDGVDYTDHSENLQWTAVDPGGYETCTFHVPFAFRIPQPGETVIVRGNLGVVWMGRVEESGEDIDAQRTPGEVSAVGAGVVLKDDEMSMVFIDRDLAKWQGMSRQRRINLGVNFDPITEPTVDLDVTTGSPVIRMEHTGSIQGSSGFICEAWFDAKDGKVKALHLESTETKNMGPGGVTWIFTTLLNDDDVATGVTTLMADQDNASVAFRRDTATTAQRWANIQLRYAAASPASVLELWRLVKNIAVIGNHGLTLSTLGAGLDGFFPCDIARYVFQQVGLDTSGVQSDTTYTCPHASYIEPVAHEQIVDDMANLTGWHWGVWGPDDILSDDPVAHFAAPPSEATVAVLIEEAQGLRLSRRFSDYFNQCAVTWQDAANAAHETLVTLANPKITDGTTRTMKLTLGVSNETFASQIGTAALTLAQQQSRSAGECQLPSMVRLAGGGVLPSYMVRPGLDRLRIIGLAGELGSWTDTSTARLDTFRIKRLTAVRAKGGHVTTSVELEAGMNLVEVVQARIAADTVA